MDKVFVLDSNIIVDNWRAYQQFGKNNMVVTPWVIREETDRLKKRHDEVGSNSRGYLQELEFLSRQYQLQTDGAPLSDGGVFLESFDCKKATSMVVRDFFRTGRISSDPLYRVAHIGDGDLNVIRVAKLMQDKYPTHHVELVSHDNNVLSLARANNVAAMPRKRVQVNLEKIPRGLETVVNADIVQRIHQKGDLPKKEVVLSDGLLKTFGIDLGKYSCNQYFVFKTTDDQEIKSKPDFRQVLRYDITQNGLVPLEINPFHPIAGIVPRNIEQVVLMDAVKLDHVSVVAAYGNAGTGKTLCMLAAALVLVNERRIRDKDMESVVYVTKPAVNVANEDYGFLPGDIFSKTRIHYGGVNKNLRRIMKYWRDTGSARNERARKSMNLNSASMAASYGDNLEELSTRGILKTYPLGFFRGDTILSNEILILEEGQNVTPAVMRTIITRLETGAKILVTGDAMQIDNTTQCRPEYNGLTSLVDAIGKDRYYNAMAAIRLTAAERSPLTIWAEENIH
jgi:PhoH-like ATPase